MEIQNFFLWSPFEIKKYGKNIKKLYIKHDEYQPLARSSHANPPNKHFISNKKNSFQKIIQRYPELRYSE
jgi:hypothetical protein